MTTMTDSEWITRPAACRMLNVGPRALERLVAGRRLSVLHVPGSYPRLRADEVAAVRAAALRPAVAAGEAGHTDEKETRTAG